MSAIVIPGAGSAAAGAAGTALEPIGSPLIDFPFKNYPSPDVYARTITRRYPVVGTRYTPATANRAAYTQLLTYAEALDNAAWTKTDTTVASTGYTDPLGGTTARRIVEAATTAYHNIYQAGSMASGALTGAVALKIGERSYSRVYLYNATDGLFAIALVDLTAKTATLEAGTSVRCFDVGNGWMVVVLQGTATVTNSRLYVELSNGSGARATYAGSTSNGIYAWRPTLVLGTYSALYPVDTTTVARAVSVPELDPTNPLALLLQESPARSVGDDKQELTRFFATIPANQVKTVSRAISRPTPRNTYVNTDGDTSARVTVRLYNGGSILNIADDGSLIGNCIVSATYKKLYAGIKACTLDTGPSRLTIPAHGLNSALALAVYTKGASPNITIYASGEWDIYDTNAIQLDGAGMSTDAIYVANYLKAWSPGQATVSMRQTESFAVPNVSIGIASAADITKPTIITNDIDYFLAISANAAALSSTWVEYDFNGPHSDYGPRYKLTKWEVLAGDL